MRTLDTIYIKDGGQCVAEVRYTMTDCSHIIMLIKSKGMRYRDMQHTDKRWEIGWNAWGEQTNWKAKM
jgi:hypothetical protein